MAKLLVVDDDLDMLALVRTALERDGHQVDTETDPATVQPARCQLYNLLLLDVMMPGEDGFSLCSRIRAEVDCPILFLTARAEDAALVQGFGLGADDYIKKTIQDRGAVRTGKCPSAAGGTPAQPHPEPGWCSL